MFYVEHFWEDTKEIFVLNQNKEKY